MSWRLYMLSDPRAPEHIRYIGFSKNPSDRLRRGHIQDALHRPGATHKATWLRSLLDAGVKPTLTVLPEAYDERTAVCAAEIAAIAAAKADGHDLTNGTPGGEGILEWTPELRAKTGMAIRAAYARNPQIAKHVRAKAKATRESWSAERTAAVTEKIRRGLILATASPEVRAERSKHRREEWADPEIRARRTEGMKRARQNETPEAAATRSSNLKRAWQDPAKRAAHAEKTKERVARFPRRKCVECDLVTLPGPMGKHLRHSGHTGWEPAE